MRGPSVYSNPGEESHCSGRNVLGELISYRLFSLLKMLAFPLLSPPPHPRTHPLAPLKKVIRSLAKQEISSVLWDH